jgi:hypothetical protein
MSRNQIARPGFARSSLLLAALTFAIGVGSASTALANEPKDDAVQAAKAYVAQLKAGNVKQAVVDCWDVETLFRHSFGLMYLQLPPAEQERSRKAFADFFAAPFEDVRLASLFKAIEIREATPTQFDESTVAVSLHLVNPAANFEATNTLLMMKTVAGWRITDQRQGDKQSIRTALVIMCVAEAKGPGDTIPVLIEKNAAFIRSRASGH